MKHQDVNDFVRIYSLIENIVRRILQGVDCRGSLGGITDNPSNEHVMVEIVFFNWGHENSTYIYIPYKLLSTGNGVDKFIRQEITKFNNFE